MEVGAPQGGMAGLALHPKFPDSPYVFVSYIWKFVKKVGNGGTANTTLFAADAPTNTWTTTTGTPANGGIYYQNALVRFTFNSVSGQLGNRRRLGHITKQGSSMMRFLLVEAAQVTVRSLPEWRSKYLHLVLRRGRKIAKVAMARRLAVHLFWMMRKEWNYQQLKKFGSHAGEPGNRHGVH